MLKDLTSKLVSEPIQVSSFQPVLALLQKWPILVANKYHWHRYDWGSLQIGLHIKTLCQPLDFNSLLWTVIQGISNVLNKNKPRFYHITTSDPQFYVHHSPSFLEAMGCFSNITFLFIYIIGTLHTSNRSWTRTSLHLDLTRGADGIWDRAHWSNINNEEVGNTSK